MATLTLTFTLLLYLFTFSSARISLPLNLLPQNIDAINPVPKSDTKQSIFLPSQKSESLSANPTISTTTTTLEPLKHQHQQEDADAQSKNREYIGGSNQDLPFKQHDQDLSLLSDNTISVETLHLNPSNYFRIRPINRHFRVKPSIFRIHRCNHMNRGYQKHHHFPYGNDMILAGDDSILAGQTIQRFDPSMLQGSVHFAPAKQGRFHKHHHHDQDENMMTRHPFRQYIARLKLKKQVEEEIQKRKERDARKQGGFMKSVRKFLNHF